MSDILPFNSNRTPDIDQGAETHESTGNALFDGIRERLVLRDSVSALLLQAVAEQDPSVMDYGDVPVHLQRPRVALPSNVIPQAETAQPPYFEDPYAA